jgi:hypothetical protein
LRIGALAIGSSFRSCVWQRLHDVVDCSRLIVASAQAMCHRRIPVIQQ